MLATKRRVVPQCAAGERVSSGMPPAESWFAGAGEARSLAAKAQQHSGKDAKKPGGKETGITERDRAGICETVL